MVTGPLQLLLVGFDRRPVDRVVADELERLRDSASVRVLDAIAVHKDAAGAITTEPLSARPGAGSLVGGLIGLDVDDEGGLDMDPLAEDEGWDVLADIPDDTAAALVLVEHAWTVPLREAVARAGGFRISDGFIADAAADTFASRRLARRVG